jgi:beta-glucanase (GH16 family)
MRRRIAQPIVVVLVLAGLLAGVMPALAASGSGRRAARHRDRSAAVRHRHRSARVRHRHRHRSTARESPRRGTQPANSASAPSGVPMPAGNIPGWREVFADNFTGTSLDSQWTAYWGVPGGDPGGFFDPKHVTVENGELVISAYKDPSDDAWDAGPNTYVTGGVSTSPSFAQTYGKYLVRFRFGAGVGIAHTILLWPKSNTWPPEIDFSEDNGANRQTDYATLHYGANNTQVQKNVNVNLTQWHTLGVEWTPGRLVYTLDGEGWATVTGAEVPSTPMTLDIQTQGWACGTSTWEKCPNATTPSHVNLYVDWVVAYAPR